MAKRITESPDVREILDLAKRAERSDSLSLAHALYEVAGRMARVPGGDGFDAEEEPDAAYARGLQRASRLTSSSRSSTAMARDLVGSMFGTDLAGSMFGTD